MTNTTLLTEVVILVLMLACFAIAAKNGTSGKWFQRQDHVYKCWRDTSVWIVFWTVLCIVTSVLSRLSFSETFVQELLDPFRPKYPLRQMIICGIMTMCAHIVVWLGASKATSPAVLRTYEVFGRLLSAFAFSVLGFIYLSQFDSSAAFIAGLYLLFVLAKECGAVLPPDSQHSDDREKVMVGREKPAGPPPGYWKNEVYVGPEGLKLGNDGGRQWQQAAKKAKRRFR